MIINTGLRTDIPAFFSKWFLNRIDEGYVYVRNPYYKNQVLSYRLDPEVVDCIMFCTKNPKPLLKDHEGLSKFNQYWHVTITPYEREIEPNVPPIKDVIKSFKALSDKFDEEKVTLRYDPIFINQKYTLDYHIEAFEDIVSSLSDYTNNVIISFIDLYKKTQRNFPGVKAVTDYERLKIGEEFSKITDYYNLNLKTCVEGDDLAQFGVDCTGCMTKEVVEKALGRNMRIKAKKVRHGQCNCLLNNDIGTYNTCNHGCIYCYANANKNLVNKNLKRHNPNSPLLLGEPRERDKVIKAKQRSFFTNEKSRQTKLY